MFSLTCKFMRIFTRNCVFDSDNQKQWHALNIDKISYCGQSINLLFFGLCPSKETSLTYKWFSYLISALWQWNPLSQLYYLVKNVPVLNNGARWTNKHETLKPWSKRTLFRLLLLFCENTFTIVFTVFLISCSALNGKNDIIVECGVCLR